jgi:hypothetical protein
MRDARPEVVAHARLYDGEPPRLGEPFAEALDSAAALDGRRR